jgi:hypothetical protein
VNAHGLNLAETVGQLAHAACLSNDPVVTAIIQVESAVLGISGLAGLFVFATDAEAFVRAASINRTWFVATGLMCVITRFAAVIVLATGTVPIQTVVFALASSIGAITAAKVIREWMRPRSRSGRSRQREWRNA